MSMADWIIIAFLLFSVVGAAAEGFFHEAFGLAGLVVGYLLAAWQYRRVADWFAPHLKSLWVGEIAGFLIIFFAVLIVAGFAGRTARWTMRKAGLNAIAGLWERFWVCCGESWWWLSCSPPWPLLRPLRSGYRDLS